MLYAVSDQTVAAGIPVHERMEAVALIHDGGRCHGAIVRNLVDRRLRPMSPAPPASPPAASGASTGSPPTR
jgi:succinate dehydrogenase/fumarate reductase flavoprotein subunit